MSAEAFVQAMQDSPNHLHLRMDYADWLEKNGDPRSELLRLSHALTQSIALPDRPGMEFRLRELLGKGVSAIGPFFTNSVGMKFAWIPPGTFLMGSPAHEVGRADGETLHEVTLSKGFYMGVYPVTQLQWQNVAGKLSGVGGDDHPVQDLSWERC